LQKSNNRIMVGVKNAMIKIQASILYTIFILLFIDIL